MRLVTRIVRLYPLPVATLAFLVGGVAVGMLTDGAVWRNRVWFAGLLVCGLPVALRTARGLLRGEFAADVVAMLAIVGAIGLNEPLAGLVIVLMQTGGEALDAFAVSRASNAVAALEADAPHLAHRLVDGRPVDIAASVIDVGDLLLVRPGELVPCDGEVVSGRSHVDASRLTGEAVPVTAVPGSVLPSGAVNQEGALTIRALRTSQESRYAKIVELVRNAQASKSPLQRTADRWAIWFTPFTLLACVVAWYVSRDMTRVLAVLVVATPCPLILAAPVAIIGGINRAAKRAIIVRNGGALEALAKVQAAVFDKTGTLTIGRPHIRDIVVPNGGDPAVLLSKAAAVEEGSGHLLARVVVEEAHKRGVYSRNASELHEVAGRGVRGVVDGERVVAGAASFVREELPQVSAAIDVLEQSAAGLRAYFATGSGEVARVDFADEVREDAVAIVASLEQLGVRDVALLSGDREENVAEIASRLGIRDYAGNLEASDKATRVGAMERAGTRVVMIGDGTNDAPALSTASVGVALAGHGGGVVAESADIVLLVDDPARVPEAIRISRRTMRIAQESIGVGLGLSAVGMVFAAAGLLTPVAGALVQEAIDVAVILNALRASR